ncbi:MAG: glycosyltransferase family 4 protein, partial [Bryobacteraceae bacterium]
IYLEQHAALFRRTPRFVDRLWDNRAVLNWAARRSIPVAPKMLGELTVSMLRGENGYYAKELGKLLDWLRADHSPDVVTLSYALLLGLAEPLKKTLGRPICCTLQGEDLFLDGLVEPYRTQSLDLIRANLQHVDAFLPTSQYYRTHMSAYLGIPPEKMHVVPIGVNLQGHHTGFKFHTNCFTVGYFARIAPEKGLHVLCDAYCRLRRETDFSGATLEAAGYLAPEHRGYLRDIERRMRDAGFAAEFQYRGVLNRTQKIEFLRNLDVMSVPCEYDEPKGISLLEAMANGVPVVGPRRGSIPEIVETAGGGRLYDPGDPAGLTGALYTMWKDRAAAEQLGAAGARGVREHYSIQRVAERTLEVYRAVATRAAAGV